MKCGRFPFWLSPTVPALLPFFRAVMLAAGVLLMPAAVAHAQSPTLIPGPPDNEGWRTVIYPIHAWLPVFGANVQLPEEPGDGGPTVPTGETSGHLNYAALAGFRLERWRVAIDGQFLWAGLSGSLDVPRFHLGVDTIEFKLTAGFEVVRAVYVDAGVHHVSLDVNASLLDFPEMTWKPAVWEPLIGFTFRPQLGRNVRILSHADFGWTEDNRTTSAEATIEWKPWAHFSLGGGYGYSSLTTNGTLLTKPVHLSQTLHGPTVLIGIPF